jgi:ABC-2 type transport system permease protein
MNSPIYIMWERQIKRYWRSRTRVIGSLGQPLLFMVALGLGFGPVFSQAGMGDYMTFLVPGIMSMSILFTATFNGMEVIWDRQFGFLKETLVAPVSRFSIMLGKTLGGATVSFVQGIIVMLLSLLLGFRFPDIAGLLAGFVFMAGIALLFTSVGISVASKMMDMHGFQLIINFMIMPIFFLSGAIFPLANLPPSLTIITRLNPLTYGVDGLRGSLTGDMHFPIWLNIIVIYGVAFVFLALGSYLFSRTEA